MFFQSCLLLLPVAKRRNLIFLAFLSLVDLAGPEADGLSQKGEPWLVREETEDDQVSIEAIKAVAGVWVKPWLAACRTNVVHDLVLTLAWHFMPRVYYLQVLPQRVGVDLELEEILEMLGQLHHEIGPWGNGVAVKLALFSNNK